MARPLRLEIPGGSYHVTSRGNGGQDVFRDDDDRNTFLRVVQETVRRLGWACWAYCLMGNHYHLLVETPNADLSRGMRQINGRYAQRFNRRHETYGHLFQSRYAATLVQRDAHLLAALRYICRNPVEAGLCKDPRDWGWSSHRSVIGAAPAAFVAVAEVRKLCADVLGGGLHAYERLIYEDGGALPPLRPAVAGDDDFARGYTASVAPTSEIPRREWQPVRPSLAELLARHEGDEGIVLAHLDYGFRLREIAEVLECHVSTVSRRLRRWEERQMLDCKT